MRLDHARPTAAARSLVRDRLSLLQNERGKTDDGTWGPLSTRFGCEGSAANKIGPEFGFGYRMADALQEQILIIKTAWGGKTLAGDFRPPSSCALVRTNSTFSRDAFASSRA